MSFETFKKILDKVPDTLTQIAFGIGDIDANPDLWKMMKYARGRVVASNLTINGQRMNSQYYDLIASNCGATAVSLYDRNTCYDAVKELSDRGLNQTNIHCLLSEENYDTCKQALVDMKKDPRLENLNALVFLWLKPRGDRNTCHKISSLDKLKKLVEYAFDNNLRIGFDSCSSPYFLKTIHERSNYKQIKTLVEPCESTLFSYYINVDGLGYPCSFNETPDNGVDTVNCNDFLNDVWNAPETAKFRQLLHMCKRSCPTYHLDPFPA
jgi:MoaA/NifB/PqqE/SkfB family radical SAM enzyme